MTAPCHLAQFLADLSQASARSVAEVYREAVQSLGFSPLELQGWEDLSPSGLREEGVNAVTYRVGLDLAYQVEADQALAYHNRTHAAEVVLAGGWLAQAEFLTEPAQRKEAGLVLLTALVAHDLGHQGMLPAEPVGTMEAISAARSIDAWRPYGYPRAFVVAAQRVACVILGTEFTRGPAMNAALLQAHPEDWQVRVRVLANDADILASVLPWSGTERTERLVTERRQCGHAHPEAIAGWSYRLKFLRATVLRSKGALLTGCVAAQACELLAIEQEGAAVLEALPHEEAQALVLAYVDGSSMGGPRMSQNVTVFSVWPSVLAHLFERYQRIGEQQHEKVADRLGQELADRVVNLCAHARQNINALAEDKANRWLGFVQGILIAAEVIGVDDERDYTRPLFHAIKGVSPSHDVGKPGGPRA